MTPRTEQLIDGANRALASAQRELAAGDLETAAERACAAMLRLAKACLDVEGVSAGATASRLREVVTPATHGPHKVHRIGAWTIPSMSAQFRLAAASCF